MIIKSFFTNSFGILTSRIFGFIRDLLTASILGANIYSDIFFVAFKLPNLFRRIFAEGAFLQSFIPAFVRTKHKSLFTYRTFLNFFAFLILFSLIVTLFSPFFTKAMALGFDAQTIEIAAPLVAINFYYLPLIFAVTFIASLLQYKNHFATTAFSTALLNIAIILSLLLFQGFEKIQIVYAMSYAVLIGGLLQLLTHILVAKHKNVIKLFFYGFTCKKKTPQDLKKDEKKFFTTFWHAIIGNSTPQISAFLDTWIASFLASGSISYLYYANRVFQLPLALFAIALSVGIFPKISRYIKNNDEEKSFFMFKNGFWILNFLLTFSMIGGFILSEEIIQILFQRGSFSAEDTIVSAQVLQMYLIGLLPFGLAKIFSLWLYAAQKQKTAAKISLYALASNVLFYLLFVQSLGVAGLALSSSCAGFVLLGFTIKEFGLKKFLDIIWDKKLAIFIGMLLLYVPLLLKIKEIINDYL